MGDHEKVLVVFCGLAAIVFMILTIVVPIVIVSNPESNYCHPFTTMRRGEQIICHPDSYDLWTVNLGDDSVIKVYKPSSDSTLNTVVREINWPYNYIHLNDHSGIRSEVSSGIISIYNPVYLTGEMTVKCETISSCSGVKVYFLSESEYYDAMDNEGTFHDYYLSVSPLKDGLEIGKNNLSLNTYITGSNYIVFSEDTFQEVELTVDISMNYTAYDLKSYSPEICSYEFCDVYAGYSDQIILDYPPENIDIDKIFVAIYEYDVNWSSVLASAFVFGFLTIAFTCVTIFFCVKLMKKVGEKVAKNTGTVVAPAPAAVAPVAMQPVAQPYPAGQPYPAAQPYPAGQPYPAQPYPAQPYPGQPYPDAAYAAQPQPAPM